MRPCAAPAEKQAPRAKFNNYDLAYVDGCRGFGDEAMRPMRPHRFRVTTAVCS
jgi:hypothetical protein